MLCPDCGFEGETDVCPNCNQPASASEVTGTLSADALTLESDPETIADVLPAGHAALRVTRGPLAGEVWTLDGKEIVAGRSADCSLFLDDITVSRNHAKFTEINGEWFIEDLGSLNGTYVNNKIIEEKVELANQMEIQIGKFRFGFFKGESV
jgi:pSer/pThr/pTyr-binding forkhead associated (FHA) protein